METLIIMWGKRKPPIYVTKNDYNHSKYLDCNSVHWQTTKSLQISLFLNFKLRSKPFESIIFHHVTFCIAYCLHKKKYIRKTTTRALVLNHIYSVQPVARRVANFININQINCAKTLHNFPYSLMLT